MCTTVYTRVWEACTPLYTPGYGRLGGLFLTRYGRLGGLFLPLFLLFPLFPVSLGIPPGYSLLFLLFPGWEVPKVLNRLLHF